MGKNRTAHQQLLVCRSIADNSGVVFALALLAILVGMRFTRNPDWLPRTLLHATFSGLLLGLFWRWLLVRGHFGLFGSLGMMFFAPMQIVFCSHFFGETHTDAEIWWRVPDLLYCLGLHNGAIFGLLLHARLPILAKFGAALKEIELTLPAAALESEEI